MHDATLYDVVIAGAGPVGLFLACELRLARLSVLVLEQAATPHSPLKQLPFGMRGLSSLSIEAFYRRGLLVDIAAQPRAHAAQSQRNASAAHWMQHVRRPGGHLQASSSSTTRSMCMARSGRIACLVRPKPTWPATWPTLNPCSPSALPQWVLRSGEARV